MNASFLIFKNKCRICSVGQMGVGKHLTYRKREKDVHKSLLSLLHAFVYHWNEFQKKNIPGTKISQGEVDF